MKRYRLRKRAALFLAAALLFTSLAIVPANSAQLQSEQTFGHISEHKAFYDANKDAVDKIANDLWDMKTTVNIYEYRIPTEELGTLVNTVIHTHPELFYVSGRYFCNERRDPVTKKYYLSDVFFHWGKVIFDANGNDTDTEELFTKEQALEMRRTFFEKAQWYLDMVDDSMSDFEKALVLHDALAINSEYLISEEIYELMVNGRGKCYGYSEVYSYLLAQVGINSEIVESNEMNHQWNKVEIDGEYYHVDVTWDDPYPPDMPGFAQHDFFLLSDSAIESLTISHTGYESDFPSTNTRFDNCDFHNIDTQFCFANGGIYAVDNRFSGNTGKSLFAYDPAEDSAEKVVDFSNEYWDAGDGYVWSIMSMSLAEQDDYLYMNHEHGVYVFDTHTGELSGFAGNDSGSSFYGLRIIDGKVYAVLAAEPQTGGELYYVGDCLVREEPISEDTTAGSTEQPTGSSVEETTAEPTEPAEPATQPPTIMIGDTDGDGTVTVKDATTLQMYLAEFLELTPEQLAAADVNRDGKVNIRDVTQLQRFLAEYVSL